MTIYIVFFSCEKLKQSAKQWTLPPQLTAGENQSKRKERLVLEPWQRSKNVMEHESDDDINYNWCDRNGPQRLGKGSGKVGNQRMS